jgi:hypothetical protein
MSKEDVKELLLLLLDLLERAKRLPPGAERTAARGQIEELQALLGAILLRRRASRI